MNAWVRLYHDTPSDPKWRVIAKKSGQRIGDVIAVWTFVLTNASGNAVKRGVTHNFVTEDVAAALDLATSDVDAILSAMEGKVIVSGKLTGWEKRNPDREDDSSDRVRRYRERRRSEFARDAAPVTQCNAPVTQRNAQIREDKIREEKKDISAPRRAQKRPIPPDWQPSEDHKTLASELSVDWRDVAQTFRDYLQSSGKQYADYDAAFRNFLKNERKFHGARNGPDRKKSELIEACDGLIERIQGWGTASGLEIGGGTDTAAVRLLPKG